MSLSTTDVARIIALLQDGISQVYVVENLGIPRRKVRKTFLSLLEIGTYSHRPGSGRRRVTTQRDIV